MRRATTLVEAVIAGVIGLLIVTAAGTLFVSIRRMAQASDLAGTQQDAALTMATIHRDLTLAVQKPDPASTSPVLLRPDAFQVLQNALAPDGGITAKRVAYRAERTPAGNFRLHRQADGEDRLMPGVYSSILFEQFAGSGGPFVRVTMHLSVHDAATADPARGSESAVLTALVRVQGPELVTSTCYAWSFLDALRGLDFSKDF